MDKVTIDTYDLHAESIAKMHDTIAPKRLYELIDTFFRPNAKTLDIGCGSGRDSYWLFKQGFSVLGVDASEGMLEQARKRYKSIQFSKAELPELSNVPTEEFRNALCSAVLMHLRLDLLPLAAKHILRVLVNDAVLLISIRGTEEKSKRENGKLYEDIKPERIKSAFVDQGAELLLYENFLEIGRNHLWHTFLFKK